MHHMSVQEVSKVYCSGSLRSHSVATLSARAIEEQTLGLIIRRLRILALNRHLSQCSGLEKMGILSMLSVSGCYSLSLLVGVANSPKQEQETGEERLKVVMSI